MSELKGLPMCQSLFQTVSVVIAYGLGTELVAELAMEMTALSVLQVKGLV